MFVITAAKVRKSEQNAKIYLENYTFFRNFAGRNDCRRTDIPHPRGTWSGADRRAERSHRRLWTVYDRPPRRSRHGDARFGRYGKDHAGCRHCEGHDYAGPEVGIAGTDRSCRQGVFALCRTCGIYHPSPHLPPEVVGGPLRAELQQRTEHAVHCGRGVDDCQRIVILGHHLRRWTTDGRPDSLRL